MSFPRRRESMSSNRIKQVFPIRILLINSVNFPLPVPFLHLSFSQDCRFNTIALFVIHEHMNGILLRKSFDQVILMLVYLLTKSLVTPIYRVPFGLLAKM